MKQKRINHNAVCSTLSILLAFSFLISTSGCAVVTAIKQPPKKNLQLLNQGISRDNVVAYFGAPISSETKDGKTFEIYKFRQGYSGANKATRATVHVIMDFLTFFIWEVVAWPAEAIVDGHDMVVKITFDEEKKIEDVVFLQK